MSKKKQDLSEYSEDFSQFLNAPSAAGQQNSIAFTPPAAPAKCAKVLVRAGKREYQGIVLGHAKTSGHVSYVLVRSTSYVFWNSDTWESVYDVFEVE